MKNICIIDTETTGLDPNNGQILEIAAILFNIPTRSVLAQASVLLPANENPAYDINRIEIDALKNMSSVLSTKGIEIITDMIKECDAVVAHNAEFDKKWIEKIYYIEPIIRNKKWICTRNDVIWPVRKGCPLNLIHICADLGVPIVDTHRALSDCLLLMSALICIEDIEEFLEKSGKGRVMYHANTTYDQRQLVKDAGFMWDNVKKVWYAKLLPEQAAVLPFHVYPVENPCEKI